MQIERIFYPVKTLGYGNRIGIWTLGCNKNCKDCSNPELQEFNSLKDKELKNVLKLIKTIKDFSLSRKLKVDGVTITGGEPFLQREELRELIYYINKNITEDILIYTGFTLEELRSMKDATIEDILSNISVLIDGEYIDELNDNKSLRGSSNQKIHFLKPQYIFKYQSLLKGQRESSVILAHNEMIAIGIPRKDYRDSLQEKFRAQGITLKD